MTSFTKPEGVHTYAKVASFRAPSSWLHMGPTFRWDPHAIHVGPTRQMWDPHAIQVPRTHILFGGIHDTLNGPLIIFKKNSDVKSIKYILIFFLCMKK
jgi:hypothetical protein